MRLILGGGGGGGETFFVDMWRANREERKWGEGRLGSSWTGGGQREKKGEVSSFLALSVSAVSVEKIVYATYLGGGRLGSSWTCGGQREKKGEGGGGLGSSWTCGGQREKKGEASSFLALSVSSISVEKIVYATYLGGGDSAPPLNGERCSAPTLTPNCGRNCLYIHRLIGDILSCGELLNGEVLGSSNAKRINNLPVDVEAVPPTVRG
ncbi:hypothetical protein YC2023_013026 [Brassica napus]